MSTDTNDLTQMFETVKSRVASYSTERKALADSLREIVSQAQQLLSDLGEGEPQTPAAGIRRRGRPAGTGRKRGRPAGSKNTKSVGKRGPGKPKGTGKKRTMSAEARAKIAAAQKARWAKQKAGEK